MEVNSVYQGDCLEVMKLIPDGSIDMILCDLPYGTTACKWDTIIPLEPLWEQYERIIKNNGAIVLTAAQPFTSKLVSSNYEMFKYEWIWDKVTARGHLVAKKRPMSQHENILVFGLGSITYNPQMVDRPKDKIEYRKKTEYKRTEIMGGVSSAPKDRIYDKWYPKTIITSSNASSSLKSLHPTQKPVALFEYLIKTYTNEGDLVLDNCAGSGTTGIACINLNRKYILIEQDEYYVGVIKDRISKHKASHATEEFRE